MRSEKLVIHGGRKLFGTVYIKGAKNAALPIIISSIMVDGWSCLKNVPDLLDVNTTCSLLKELGAEIEKDRLKGEVKVNCAHIRRFEAPYKFVSKMRASILTLGPLLTKYGRAKVFLPGGCAIGKRPIDMHINGLKMLGADIKIEENYIIARARRLKGAKITFHTPTVTGTENLIMAASLAKGVTLIRNAAMEPEVVDLAKALKRMGAKIEGEGTKEIEIEGVEFLKPISYRIIPDRIETGTFLIASVLTGGEVEIRGCEPRHLEALISSLKDAGVEVKTGDSTIKAISSSDILPVDITTEPYPGFPTDLQAQFMVLMCFAKGCSRIRETIFENRFMHVPELLKLGARIELSGREAKVFGVDRFSGATLFAKDIRGSAALVLAGLACPDETVVCDIYHLDRGYEEFDLRLKKLGADIERVK